MEGEASSHVGCVDVDALSGVRGRWKTTCKGDGGEPLDLDQRLRVLPHTASLESPAGLREEGAQVRKKPAGLGCTRKKETPLPHLFSFKKTEKELGFLELFTRWKIT